MTPTPKCCVCSNECGRISLGGDIAGFKLKRAEEIVWICSECAYDIAVEYTKRSQFSAGD